MENDKWFSKESAMKVQVWFWYIQDNSKSSGSMGSKYCTSCNGKTGFSRTRKGMVIVFDMKFPHLMQIQPCTY